jgi:hypothetical protein
MHTRTQYVDFNAFLLRKELLAEIQAHNLGVTALRTERKAARLAAAAAAAAAAPPPVDTPTQPVAAKKKKNVGMKKVTKRRRKRREPAATYQRTFSLTPRIGETTGHMRVDGQALEPLLGLRQGAGYARAVVEPRLTAGERRAVGDQPCWKSGVRKAAWRPIRAARAAVPPPRCKALATAEAKGWYMTSFTTDGVSACMTLGKLTASSGNAIDDTEALTSARTEQGRGHTTDGVPRQLEKGFRTATRGLFGATALRAALHEAKAAAAGGDEGAVSQLLELDIIGLDPGAKTLATWSSAQTEKAAPGTYIPQQRRVDAGMSAAQYNHDWVPKKTLREDAKLTRAQARHSRRHGHLPAAVRRANNARKLASTKVADTAAFMEAVKVVAGTTKVLRKFYMHKQALELKFTTRVKKQQAVERAVSRIAPNSDAVIAFGDAFKGPKESWKGMKDYPAVTVLLRALAARRRVVYTNEYRTSKRCHVCVMEGEEPKSDMFVSHPTLARMLPGGQGADAVRRAVACSSTSQTRCGCA